MLGLVLLLVVPAILWAGQSALLRYAGLPLRWQLSARDLPRELKRINRGITYAAFGVALAAYPLLRGQSPVRYYGEFLPWDSRVAVAAVGAAGAVLYLALLYFAWLITGNVRFEIRHRTGRLVRRLLTAPLIAVCIALLEELLFRALLLADLQRTWPAVIALPVGVVVFAGAHYVRGVKRYWTFPGHLALGLLFCVAFFATGTIWLSAGLHAGGVWVLMAVRPFIRYTGPAWLVGASIFPYAGVVGVAALLMLTLNVWLAFGATP
jgi:membrane protease YdiL (CAAX protease family)